MTSENLDRLREMQRQIEFDAQGALSRAELQRLRQYWGDIQQVLDNEPPTE
jgi:hypothetical protein